MHEARSSRWHGGESPEGKGEYGSRIAATQPVIDYVVGMWVAGVPTLGIDMISVFHCAIPLVKIPGTRSTRYIGLWAILEDGKSVNCTVTGSAWRWRWIAEWVAHREAKSLAAIRRAVRDAEVRGS